MNKTAIKNFSIWARNKLITDISYRAGLMGITDIGIADPLSQSTDMTEFYDIGTTEPYTVSGTEIKQRRDLVDAIHRKEADSDYETAYNYIIEEVAYTWFNRLIAVRFMEVNDYLPSHIRVLSSESGKMEPDLVTTPFDADLEFTAEEEKQIIRLKRENALDEMFRLLFVKQCNALNSILPGLFEKTGDYTELLLNLSVTDKNGVVYHLVRDIDEADFDVETKDESGNAVGQVEIIGWLYQYYNTEPKEKVFDRSSGTKIKKEQIPAATQLFTPDWIVRYMVENSLGRLWIEGHPNNELKTGWKYYFKEAKQESKVEVQLDEIHKEHSLLTPEDIKFIDPCMGSGHILAYAFDVLMQIYEIQGYTKQDAVKSILENNIYGLDIDERATQLSYFSVMMKARSYDKRFLNRNIQPHVYAIQESNNLSKKWLPVHGQMQTLFNCMEDAKDFGSLIVTPNLDYNMLRCSAQNYIQEIEQMDFEMDEMQQQLSEVLSLIDVAEILSLKYDVVVTNPPYMRNSNMNAKLSDFIKRNYLDYKSDFFSAFIVRCKNMGKQEGNLGFLSPYVWMFIQSYEKLRNLLYSEATIETLIQFEYSAFEEATVPVCTFTIRNKKIEGEKGCYLRLTEFRGGMEVQREKTLEAITNHNCGFYFEQCSDNFYKIPGSPVAFSLNPKLIFYFDGTCVGDFCAQKMRICTGNNDMFLRLWYEVDYNNVFYPRRWVPLSKGGAYRKWFGNWEYILDYENDGYKLKHYKGFSGGNDEFYFKPGLVWTDISSGKISFRDFPAGAIASAAGPMIYSDTEEKRYYLAGYLNSVVANEYVKTLCVTLHFQWGDIAKIPLIYDEKYVNQVNKIVKENISYSKIEWDSFETSWDFQYHPLTRMGSCVSKAFEKWKAECDNRFCKIKNNEKNLNSIFMEIFELQDELTSEVGDKDVTVREADLQRDIRSLLSYAVGCMFGRYSLDMDGLAYAGGDWDDNKYISFQPDADDIIPITDEEYLEDDIVSYLCQWLKVVYGEETLEENLDFIAQALGNKGDSSREIIRNYFLKDFFTDHCKIYQKRPIYWLFDSGKQNGFKALVYLHRYTPDTIGNLRIDYLHRMQRIYDGEIIRMQDTIDHSDISREVTKATKRKEKLQKQLKECQEYDGKISHLALSRIGLELDDGVKVNYEKLQTAQDGKKYQVLAKI